MSLLPNRATLAREMRDWVRSNGDVGRLQRAMDLLHPGGPRPDVGEIVTAVIYSALRGHEAHTSGVLTRLNEAMARTLDDLATLRAGEGLGGRTAAMRAADLTQIAAAMDELATLEQRIRTLIDTDGDGVWAHALRGEIEAGLMRPPAPVGALAHGAVAATQGVAGAVVGLRDAIHAIAPAPAAIWATRQLPDTIRAAAVQMVRAAGSVDEAVRSAIRAGGAAADDLVIAILWASDRIEPRSRSVGTAPFDLHQQQVTDLPFEWKGEYRPNQGAGLGIDGFGHGGYLLDAKHLDGPLETSPFVTGRRPARSYEPRDLVGELEQAAQAPTAEQRRAALTDADTKLGDTLRQMRDQLLWAQENGLRGVRWVCNTEELADYFARIARDHLEAPFRDMDLRFVVGGMTGGR